MPPGHLLALLALLARTFTCFTSFTSTKELLYLLCYCKFFQRFTSTNVLALLEQKCFGKHIIDKGLSLLCCCTRQGVSGRGCSGTEFTVQAGGLKGATEFTVLLYLNEGMSGGETVFYKGIK